MVHRIIKPLKSKSFFLFGARGVGKSTWVKSQILTNSSLTIDLLLADTEDKYSRRPEALVEEIEALESLPDWIFIDEVQKVPKLLDSVHFLIENKGAKFILSGSSARKLKRGQANLLAGRSFLINMFPLSHYELGDDFEILESLKWGFLPGLLNLSVEEKQDYLRAYTKLYLKEEIQMEQVVRKLLPFRNFLEIAAQSSGKIINASRISRQVGVDTKTVQSYFQILEDTLLGFYLPAFHRSVRKSQKSSPKFYFFDTGVKRALEGLVDSDLKEGSYVYGDLFEHFIINEIHKLNHYMRKDYKMSYFQTPSGGEIDVVLSKGEKLLLIEIKSGKQIDPVDVKKFARIAEAFNSKQIKKFFISQNPKSSLIDGVLCCHWKQFFKESFLD